MSEIDFKKNEWEVADALQAFYIPYSSYVIQTRALPDARDGLKTGARFILFSQYKDKLTYKEKRRKAVATVSAAMRFSPHGDSSILGTAVRLSQDFSMRYPIIEVQGNNGSYLSGDDYSQARYLEMRGNKIAYEMTHLLEKETIDKWKMNYTQEELYPTVLPSKFPFSLVNGSFGIGVACSSSIPPHCITDVCDAIEKVIRNKDIDFNEIYCPIDFPTGGIIINEDEVKESLKNGHGAAALVRAKIEYDEKANELIVTEMPYMTFTTNAVQSISKAIEDGLVTGVENVYDGTDYSGCKIYIKLEKNTNSNKVLRDLYKHTLLQNSFSINMNMLEDGKIPKMFTWKESIIAYIEHLKNIIVKSYQFDLKKLEERIHILNGLIIAYQNIEEVVKLIRESNNNVLAKEKLMNKYNLTEVQSDAILKMRLSSLTHLEIDKLQNEKETKEKEANKIKEILSSEDNIKNEMIAEIQKLKKEYGDSRRTINMNLPKETSEDKEIENVQPEDCIVILSKNNEIKRAPLSNYKVQKRGGKGTKNKNEIILDTIHTNTIDNLLIFTNKGKMYKILVDDILENKGVNINTLISTEIGEEVIAITSLNRTDRKKYVVFITKNGLVKKSKLEEYLQSKKSKGIIAIKLESGDSIANVIFMDEEELILVTKQGMGIKFESAGIAAIGRNTKGVKAIKLDEGDEVLTGLSIDNKNNNILIITKKGLGKKIKIDDVSIQGRGGKGIILSKEEIAGSLIVKDNDNILVTGYNNSICISTNEIPILGRVAAGNIIIKDNVQSIVKV